MLPVDIKNVLDANIFGQAQAKEAISTAFYIHLLRNGIVKKEQEEKLLPKTNVILIGNAGTGKSLLLSTLCDNFKLPYVKIDASTLLTTNNMGEMLDAYLRYLVMQFGIDKASTSLICIDGFDQISNRQIMQSGQGMSIQQDLLQMIEQPQRMLVLEKGKEPVLFPLEKLMFVFSGRFIGLESLVYVRTQVADTSNEALKLKEERLKLIEKYRETRKAKTEKFSKVAAIGFGKNESGQQTIIEPKIDVTQQVQSLYEELKDDDLEQMINQAYQKDLMENMHKDFGDGAYFLKDVNYTDLINYGVLPELVGRVGFIIPLEQLNKEDIIGILKRKEGNVIDMYTNYFKIHNDVLHIQDEVYDLLAQEVLNRAIGTRSINAIITQLLQTVLYSSPNLDAEHFTIDAAFFNKAFSK